MGHRRTEKAATDIQKGNDFEWFGVKVKNRASEHMTVHKLVCTDDPLNHRQEIIGTTPW